jgi:anthranilate/para-aminobenzoate synthase component I
MAELDEDNTKTAITASDNPKNRFISILLAFKKRRGQGYTGAIGGFDWAT